ncbi:MAG TPA: hypoxanthine phosphoribosyltransferase [Actinomycetota bacterium]|nr:hypoxanthine phosphoribosyltransferase [Actinomycetota bacterium]
MASTVGEVVLDAETISSKVRELGQAITRDYRGREITLIGVLKGAFMLMADLSRCIELPLRIDFMAVSSYGSATKTSGVVRILKDLDQEIEGCHVIVVEDIIDSGLTLNYLLRYLRARRPATLEVCALFSKRGRQRVEIPVRYEGFSIRPEFVVGYGLDYRENYRNLSYVALLDPDPEPPARPR